MELKKENVYLPVNNEWEEGKPTLMSSDGEWVCNLEKKEGYFFSPEQLNQLLSEVIKNTHNVVFDNAKITYISEWSDDKCIDRISITETYDVIFNKFKV